MQMWQLLLYHRHATIATIVIDALNGNSWLRKHLKNVHVIRIAMIDGKGNCDIQRLKKHLQNIHVNIKPMNASFVWTTYY